MLHCQDNKPNTSVEFFDTSSDIYNEIRPAYNEEVYTAISEFLKPGKTYKILEIGAGNGIATERIYDLWKPELTLLEPGKNLSRLLIEKFGSEPNIEIINDCFESAELKEEYFHAVVSATSFHWLNNETKYTKSHKLLKENGLLIVFWNNYGIDNPDLSAEIQQIYTANTGKKLAKSIGEIQSEKIDNRKNEIINSGLFELLTHRIFTTEIRFAGAEYIKLLKTFPDHAAFPDAFFTEMATVFEKSNNTVTVKITLNLNVARRKSIWR
ncbi:MAG: class I SAM-dependent methyltransferase [Bacteroidia bacterium]|nr:class I SAM-dependent methyltransferase [Bacteroidia bacterium]